MMKKTSDFSREAGLTLIARLPNSVLGLRDKFKGMISGKCAADRTSHWRSRFMFQTDLNRPVHDMAYAVSITCCREILEKIAQEFERTRLPARSATRPPFS